MNMPNDRQVTLVQKTNEEIKLKIASLNPPPLLLQYNGGFYVFKEGKYYWALPMPCDDHL